MLSNFPFHSHLCKAIYNYTGNTVHRKKLIHTEDKFMVRSFIHFHARFSYGEGRSDSSPRTQ